MVERFNRTLSDALAKLVGERQWEWVDYLGQVQLEYNTNPHRVTKMSPYYLMYGQIPHVAEDVLVGTRPRPVLPQSKWEDNIRIAVDRI
ncbi:MAG: hypothetical protein ACK56F_17870, partial [bacterium]